MEKTLAMDKSKDRRYELIKPMLERGQIEKFSDIFKFIPKTTVAHDIGMDLTRWNQRVKSFDQFKVSQLVTIAALCEISERDMMDLVLAERAFHKNRTK